MFNFHTMLFARVSMRAVAKFSILALSLALAQPGHCTPVRDQHWSSLAARLFPALVALEVRREEGAPKSPALDEMLKARRERMDACQDVSKCLLNASLWTDSEIDTLAVYSDQVLRMPATRAAISDDGTKAQMTRELRGLNNILKVYGLGAVPHNPQIDGPVDTSGSAQFNVTVSDAINLSQAAADDPVTKSDPSIGLGLALLDVNNRDEALAFEPLDASYNAPALSRAKTIDWNKYKYSAIIVLGNGPNDLSTPLSARGKLRVRLAASRFTESTAPFIIVSGGAVHPRGSKFVEAIEMRKMLIGRFGVPADSVIVDPYARYTETNLRNATRRLVALGAPLGRDAVILTDADHSRSIESPDFIAKNQALLGYQPGKIGARISAYELLFRPSSASLRIDPSDPLDP